MLFLYYVICYNYFSFFLHRSLSIRRLFETLCIFFQLLIIVRIHASWIFDVLHENKYFIQVVDLGISTFIYQVEDQGQALVSLQWVRQHQCHKTQLIKIVADPKLFATILLFWRNTKCMCQRVRIMKRYRNRNPYF